MAAFNQDIVRREHDGDFNLVFTVSNSGQSLGNSNFCAVWILLNTETVESTSEIQILSATPTPNTSNYSSEATSINCSNDGSTVLTDTNYPTIPTVGNADITISNTQITIEFDYILFDDLDDGVYYHELVLLKRDGDPAKCQQCQAQVVATGLLTIKESLMTNVGYR